MGNNRSKITATTATSSTSNEQAKQTEKVKRSKKDKYVKVSKAEWIDGKRLAADIKEDIDIILEHMTARRGGSDQLTSSVATKTSSPTTSPATISYRQEQAALNIVQRLGDARYPKIAKVRSATSRDELLDIYYQWLASSSNIINWLLLTQEEIVIDDVNNPDTAGSSNSSKVKNEDKDKGKDRDRLTAFDVDDEFDKLKSATAELRKLAEAIVNYDRGLKI